MSRAEIKWVTESDEYQCTLSEETQEIAERELREDKNSREQALTSMREWIMQNPKIMNCRLDAKFLLRFLRFKKYSVLQAQEALERYLLLRQTFGIAFNHLDIRIPMMQDLTDLGYLFAVPKRDKFGRRIIIARPGRLKHFESTENNQVPCNHIKLNDSCSLGVFDLERFTNADMCRIHGVVYETLMEDEDNQVRGFVHIADGQGVGFAYLTLFTIKEAVRIVKNGEKTLPMRHKEVHVVNVHPSMKFAVDFGLSLISEKIRKRFHFYTNVEDFIKANLIDLELLPKEYGGTTPMSEMIVSFKKELDAANATLLTHDKMEVNEDLFSHQAKIGAVSALKRTGTNCGSEGDMIYGITGNFRKLEVD